MIYCTLKMYLDKNHMTQSKASQLTGLTRPTLLQLIKNDNQNIRYETVEKLCVLFNIGLSDLLLYSPVDVSVHDIKLEEGKTTIDYGVSIKEGVKAYKIIVEYKIDNDIYEFDTDLIVCSEVKTLDIKELNMNCLVNKKAIQKLKNLGFNIEFLIKYSKGVQLDKLIKSKMKEKGLSTEFDIHDYNIEINALDKSFVSDIVEDIKMLNDEELEEFEYILKQYKEQNKE